MTDIMKQLSLKGKNALITGGNRGIGRSIGLAMAQAGANIAIMDLNSDDAGKTIDDIKALGVKSVFYAGDVTMAENCNQVVSELIKDFGKIDILVNNAGICKNVKAEEMTWKDWYDVINVNLNGVFLMSQAAGREMIRNKSGSIINISSMSANIVNYPQPQCSYNASKAGVSHLTRSLAYEWVKYNIRVNAIAPGYIGTDLTRAQLSTEWGKIWQDATPMKRAGKPEELGGIAVYLASDASSFTTGSIMTVDGGYTTI